MAIKVFYHICCINDDTGPIVFRTINNIIFSRLYNTVDIIYCFLVGEKEEIARVAHILKESGPKFHIQAIGYDDTTYERFTLRAIPGLITEEDKILYIHSKGIKHIGTEREESIHHWRVFLEYMMFTHHELCIAKLSIDDDTDNEDHYDIIGCLWETEPLPHFSGNFWWTTGKYYLSLDLDKYLPGEWYLEPEMLIARNNPRVYVLSQGVDGKRPDYNVKFPFSRYL